MSSFLAFLVNAVRQKCGWVPQIYGYDCAFLLTLPVPHSDIFWAYRIIKISQWMV